MAVFDKIPVISLPKISFKHIPFLKYLIKTKRSFWKFLFNINY